MDQKGKDFFEHELSQMATNTGQRAQLLEKINTFRKQLDELKKKIYTADPKLSDEVFLNSFLEYVPDYIYFKDTESRFMLINRAYAHFLGLAKPEDAYGKTEFDFFEPAIAQNSFDDDQYVIKTGKSIINKRVKVVLPDNTYRWVSVSKVPTRDNQGKIFGLVGVYRDITDEKYEEEKVGESEQRTRRLLTDTSDVISIIDRKGIVLYESPSANRIFGVNERKPRVGTNFFGFCHPEDLKEIILTFTELIQRPRQSQKIEFRFRHANGSWILLESICRNLLDDPAIKGVIVNSRDITDRKRVDERIKIFEHVVKSANDSIVITDLQNFIIFVNQSFCETYGYNSNEIIGEHVSTIWSVKNINEKVVDVFAGSRQPGWEGELYNRKKDGTDFPIYISTSIIRDESGNPIAVAGIIRDVTKQKQLEEQLRQSQKMESLSVLVGGIAHNFNNILGVIMGYASMLEDRSIERDKLDRNVRIITEAAERGAHLVQQLMTYIKKSPVRFSDVPVNEVITEMTDMVTQTFPQTIIFSVELDSRNPIIKADRNQFRQVLFNLLLNARDAMLHGGTITVKSEIIAGRKVKSLFVKADDSDYVRIAVTDTGVGMDEEIQSRIFDPFFTTKEVGKGVGLGLPMVYGIVESHQGFINVESSIEKGSTFAVYIPVQGFEESNESSNGLEDSPDESEQINDKQTILIVEDEEALRVLLSEKLTESGYSVLQASDGIEAVEIFEQEKKEISAVILDIGLPRLGGYETFVKMNEINSDIPVVIASGYNDPDAKLAIETAGARLFIQKPYKFSHLIKVVKEVVGTSTRKVR